MNSKIRELPVEFLFQAILKLEPMEECYDFFEDLCTATISRVNRSLSYGCDGYKTVFERLGK